jgi:hypothetical protein
MSDGSNPQEKEYIIGTKQEPYIDRKELEELLLKVFKKKITVYVSIPHLLWPQKLVLVAHLIQNRSTTTACSDIQPHAR